MTQAQGIVENASPPAVPDAPTPVVTTPVTTPPALSVVSDLPSDVQTLVREQGHQVVLGSDAFGKIKKAAVEKGRKQALVEYAKANGFSSVEQLEAVLKASKQPPAAAVTTPPAPAPVETRRENPVSTTGKNGRDKDVERLRRENEDLRKENRKIENRRKQQERSAQSAKAQSTLMKLAAEKGIKRPEWALVEWNKKIETVPMEQLDGFDHGKFFEDLKLTHPELFGEVVTPATTGTGNVRPSSPDPVQVAEAANRAGKIDAMKLKPNEFSSLVRGLGINA